MRISCRPGDDGYRAYQALPKGVTPIIRLDGKVIKGCVTACTKTGFVLRLETDSKGKPVINAKGDAVKYEQLHGKVEIQIKGALR